MFPFAANCRVMKTAVRMIMKHRVAPERIAVTPSRSR